MPYHSHRHRIVAGAAGCSNDFKRHVSHGRRYSHAVLPGGFSLYPWHHFIGAIVFGLLGVRPNTYIKSNSIIKSDTAIGILPFLLSSLESSWLSQLKVPPDLSILFGNILLPRPYVDNHRCCCGPCWWLSYSFFDPYCSHLLTPVLLNPWAARVKAHHYLSLWCSDLASVTAMQRSEPFLLLLCSLHSAATQPISIPIVSVPWCSFHFLHPSWDFIGYSLNIAVGSCIILTSAVFFHQLLLSLLSIKNKHALFISLKEKHMKKTVSYPRLFVALLFGLLPVAKALLLELLNWRSPPIQSLHIKILLRIRSICTVSSCRQRSSRVRTASRRCQHPRKQTISTTDQLETGGNAIY